MHLRSEFINVNRETEKVHAHIHTMSLSETRKGGQFYEVLIISRNCRSTRREQLYYIYILYFVFRMKRATTTTHHVLNEKN